MKGDEELNDLIHIADKLQDDMSEKNELVFDKPKPTVVLSNNSRQNNAEMQAKRLMDSMFRQYVSAGIMGNEEYLRAKNLVTTANIATLIRQIDICENAVASILEQIDLEGNPKLYDSLAATQRTILDLVKLQQQLIKSTEVGYKELIEDIKAVEEAKVLHENEESDVESNKQGKMLSTNRQLIEIVRNAQSNSDE